MYRMYMCCIGACNICQFLPGVSVAVKFCTFSHFVGLFVDGKEPSRSFLKDGSVSNERCVRVCD